MPRDPKPWYRQGRDAWCVTINGRRFNLGPDREAAHTRFHELMLNGGDERQLDGVSVFRLFDEFLEWTQAQRSARTYEWYSDFLREFSKFLKVDRPAEKLKPYDVLKWMARHPNWSSTYQNNAIRSVQRPCRWAHRLGNRPIQRLNMEGNVTVTGYDFGDFNRDGAVNGADYVIWRKVNGSLADYDLWRGNFGAILGSAALIGTVVPEPAIALLFLVGAGFGMGRGRGLPVRFKRRQPIRDYHCPRDRLG